MFATYENLVPTTSLDRLLGGRQPDSRMLIKLDLEGAEIVTLDGAKKVIGRTPRPVWVIEHGLTENYEGSPRGQNPRFLELFETPWSTGYAAYSAPGPSETRREIVRADVENAVRTGQRGWDGINVIFE